MEDRKLEECNCRHKLLHNPEEECLRICTRRVHMTPIQTIESLYAAFTRGDIPFILAQVAPGATWRQSKTLPWGGDYTGPEGAAEFFSKLAAEMETTDFRAHE